MAGLRKMVGDVDGRVAYLVSQEVEDEVETGLGGTTVLTEIPEMFGAETILMDRAKDRLVFEKIVSLINGFKDYFREHHQPIYENPSPGNKKGGLTTLKEKSLGSARG